MTKDEAPAGGGWSPAPLDSGAVKTIFVVDDDEDIASAVVDALGVCGYKASAFGDGRRALDALERTERLPNAILLDLMMPGMDGWTFAMEMRKSPRLRAIPIVIFSADRNPAASAQALAAAAHVRKPVTLKELLAALERVCANAP